MNVLQDNSFSDQTFLCFHIQLVLLRGRGFRLTSHIVFVSIDDAE